MNKDIITSFDPNKKSIGNLMVIVFPKSNAATYPLSVNIAQNSCHYDETIIGTKLFHMAVFATNQEDIKKALALLKYLIGLKGITVFMNGYSYQNIYSIYEVLQCYSKAINCTDYRAHCHTVIDDPFREVYRNAGGLSLSIQVIEVQQGAAKPTIIERYLFPCNHLYSYFRFQKGHPSSTPDQIQAAGINYHCEWCPYFHPNEFTKLPTKIIYPDGTIVIEPNSTKGDGL